MEKFLRLLFLAAIVSFASCDDLNQSEKNNEAIKEAIKSREIKKVSDVDILTKGEVKGRALGLEAEAALMQYLGSLDLTASTDTLAQLTHIWVDSVVSFGERRIDFVSTQNMQAASSDEQQLLEAYTYNIQNNLPVKGAIQFMVQEENLLYTHPVIVDKKACPSCLTSEDSLFIGMWSIEFSVKEIVGEL